MIPERAIRLNLIQIKYTNPYRAIIQEFIVLLHTPLLLRQKSPLYGSTGGSL